MATQEFAGKQNITWKFSSSYNPRGNAKVERMIGSLKKGAKKLILTTGKEWDECLTDVVTGYRRRPAKDGKSPFEILFGVKPRVDYEPERVLTSAKDEQLVRTFENALVQVARITRVVPIPRKEEAIFSVGEKVLLRRGGKPKGPKIWARMWLGPYTIKEESHPVITWKVKVAKEREILCTSEGFESLLRGT